MSRLGPVSRPGPVAERQVYTYVEASDTRLTMSKMRRGKGSTGYGTAGVSSPGSQCRRLHARLLLLFQGDKAAEGEDRRLACLLPTLSPTATLFFKKGKRAAGERPVAWTDSDHLSRAESSGSISPMCTATPGQETDITLPTCTWPSECPGRIKAIDCRHTRPRSTVGGSESGDGLISADNPRGVLTVSRTKEDCCEVWAGSCPEQDEQRRLYPFTSTHGRGSTTR